MLEILIKWLHYWVKKYKHMSFMLKNLSLKTIIRVASSPNQIGCVVFFYAQPTHPSVSPQAIRTPLDPS